MSRASSSSPWLLLIVVVTVGCPSSPPEGSENGACKTGFRCDDGLLCFDDVCHKRTDLQQCAPTQAVCDSDLACPGGFCDKDHDSADGNGDGIAAANDPFGCCVALSCTDDAQCKPGFTCARALSECQPQHTCDPVDHADVCDASTPCIVEGDGAPACATPAPAATCELGSRAAVVVEGGHVPLAALGLTTSGAPAAWTRFTFSVDTGALAADGTYTGCSGPALCHVTLVATETHGAVCTGSLTVLPPPVAGQTRVVVVDRTTRAPLANVEVQAAIAGAFTVAFTDADGLATFDFEADVVSALPADHDWHTIMAPPHDVVIATAATPIPTSVSGKRGTLDTSKLHSNGDIAVSFNGMPVESLVDMPLMSALGSVGNVTFELEGVTSAQPEIAASAETFFIGAQPVLADWVALGDQPLVWTIGARFEVAEYGPLFEHAPPGQLTAFFFDALELMARGDHGFVTTTIDDGPAPVASFDGAAIPSDAWPFQSIVAAPSTYPFIARTLTWPRGAPHVDAILVAGVRVPARGFVPLGVVAGHASDPTLALAFAPPHDGLEGSPVAIAAVSVNSNDVVDGVGADLSVSAAFVDASATAVPAFLDPPTASLGAGAVTASVVDGADLYRVQFDGADGRFFVWSTSAPAFDLASLTNGDQTQSRMDHARLEDIALSSSSFAALVSSDGGDLSTLDAHVARITSTPL